MSRIVKVVVSFTALSTLWACSAPQSEEIVIIEPAPVAVEPVSGKF